MRYYRLANGAYIRTKADLNHVPGVVEVTRAEALPYLVSQGFAP